MNIFKASLFFAAVLLLGQGCQPSVNKPATVPEPGFQAPAAPEGKPVFRGPTAPPNMKGPSGPPPVPEPKLPRADDQTKLLEIKARRLETKGEAPSPRYLASVVFYKNAVYVFGGQDNTGYKNDLYVLNLSDLRWRRVKTDGPTPSPRFGTPLMLDPQKAQAYLFGGQSDESPFLDDFWKLDLENKKWEQINYRQDQAAGPVADKYPVGRYGHGGIFDVSNNGPVIFGGFIGAGRSNETWRYDLAFKKWLNLSPSETERPQARCLLGAAYNDQSGGFWIFGGQSTGIPGGKPFLGDLWQFDLKKNQWKQSPDLKIEPRKWPTLSSLSNDLVLFGGESAQGNRNDLWVLHFGTEGPGPTASKFTDLKIPARNGHAAVSDVSGSRVYIFGGQGNGGKFYNDIWEIKFDK